METREQHERVRELGYDYFQGYFFQVPGERVRFEVHDRGPGVAPEHRERIFDRFHQADASDTRAVGGSGLGLAIAKEIVERSGGSIGVADREGGGAVFWVELRRPRREAAA